MLADPAIDAVVIATPPAARFALAQAALRAGKHLLLEKPVALHSDQVLALQKLALQQGCVVAVDFEYRAVPLFQQLAALLAQGALGDPWLVKLDWLMSSRADASRPWSWYSQAAAGGGVLGPWAPMLLTCCIGSSARVAVSRPASVRRLASGPWPKVVRWPPSMLRTSPWCSSS
jgi:predicted dehydrogenase